MGEIGYYPVHKWTDHFQVIVETVHWEEEKYTAIGGRMVNVVVEPKWSKRVRRGQGFLHVCGKKVIGI